MHVIHQRCAAIDLGKDTLMVAVRLQDGKDITRECRTYGTRGRDLLELSSWLSSHGVSHVVMEATGSYWKSVWHVLEGEFELTLANPAQVKNVPGRKSDVNDATWMADLLAHGLIRGSFVPPPEIAALRELTRTRKQFVREVHRHTLRIQKILDVAGLKLTGLITDVIGVSGRAILKALIAGENNPQRLADLAHPRLKAKREDLIEALHGKLTSQQRHLLSMHLTLIEGLEASIAQLDEEIAQAMQPFRALVERLRRIPGMSEVTIPGLIAEIGVDMTRFPTHRHLLSWARVCPRLDESAGKVHSHRTLKGANWTKTLLVQAAWAGVRKRDSYLRAQFQRLRARRGPKKALVAVAASMLTAVYYMIRNGSPYQDLGIHYFDQHDRSRAARRCVARLERLGFKVQLKEAAA